MRARSAHRPVRSGDWVGQCATVWRCRPRRRTTGSDVHRRRYDAVRRGVAHPTAGSGGCRAGRDRMAAQPPQLTTAASVSLAGWQADEQRQLGRRGPRDALQCTTPVDKTTALDSLRWLTDHQVGCDANVSPRRGPLHCALADHATAALRATSQADRRHLSRRWLGRIDNTDAVDAEPRLRSRPEQAGRTPIAALAVAARAPRRRCRAKASCRDWSSILVASRSRRSADARLSPRCRRARATTSSRGRAHGRLPPGRCSSCTIDNRPADGFACDGRTTLLGLLHTRTSASSWSYSNEGRHDLQAGKRRDRGLGLALTATWPSQADQRQL